jgi:hypothetical protein
MRVSITSGARSCELGMRGPVLTFILTPLRAMATLPLTLPRADTTAVRRTVARTRPPFSTARRVEVLTPPGSVVSGDLVLMRDAVRVPPRADDVGMGGAVSCTCPR